MNCISGMYFVVICIYCHIHVYAGIYIFTYDACRYLCLFLDHIVLSVLYRYTQVLLRADLVNSKGNPLVTNARLESVFDMPTICFFMALIQRYASVL